MKEVILQKNMFHLGFAAKVRWRMKYDRNPFLTTIQDKYSVRKYAKTKGIKTAKLIYSTDNANTIPFDTLPKNCFIKANHGCEWNIIRLNSEYYFFKNGVNFEDYRSNDFDEKLIEKDKISKEECIVLCEDWLNQKYLEEEWAYLNIKPKILVEEVQYPHEGKELFDYRCYTFHGKVKAISIGSLNYRKTNKNIFLDANWNIINLSRYKEALPNPLPKKPENFDEMISIAETLGSEIDFARVDLFNTSKGIILSEMTVYPEGGAPFSPTACSHFNRWLGSNWKLSPFKTTQAFFFNITYLTSLRLLGKYKNWVVNPIKVEILSEIELNHSSHTNLAKNDVSRGIGELNY